jgi:hypothetical protein
MNATTSGVTGKELEKVRRSGQSVVRGNIVIFMLVKEKLMMCGAMFLKAFSNIR